MSVELLVTCDDCGLSEGINQAVHDLYVKHHVTVASVMTNFPAAQHAFELFQPLRGLEIGVHLNLSDGFPLTELPTSSELIRSDGHFRDRLLLYAQSFFPSSTLRASIRNELIAQIEVCRRAGFEPAHLTTHTHFHVIPALREIVFELADTYNVNWVRAIRYRATILPFNPILTPDPLPDAPASYGVPDYTIPIKYWLETPPEQLLQTLSEVTGRVEMVVHPSYTPDPTFPSEVRYLPEERHREQRYLEQVMTALKAQPDLPIQLVNGHNSATA